jgi:hypothetical protein
MADPHNIKRYGEKWPQERIDAYLQELYALRDDIVISGGWAWHFMSPEGHIEYKHAHDHKDIDVFIAPASVVKVLNTLTHRGFAKVWTIYDKLPNNQDFRRYEKRIETEAGKSIKITIDLFVNGDIPERTINGWRIVEPKYLLSLYKKIHTSDQCFAVLAAYELIKKGIDPVGREELIQPLAT